MSKPSWKTRAHNLEGRVYYLACFVLRGFKPRWKTIARDFDAQLGYVMRRCLAAEGHEGDADAMRALVADAEDVAGL